MPANPSPRQLPRSRNGSPHCASRPRPTATVGASPWRGTAGQVRIAWQVITTSPCGTHP